MTESENIKEIIKKEYIHCLQDSAHFIKKYTMIQHPTRGRIPFHLFQFQEKVAHIFQNENVANKYIVINKSRQLGVSTLVAGYALWMILFHKDKNVLVIATKQETAKNMITKVQFMYEHLPSWLKLPTINDNKLSLKLSNGSQIKAVSAAGDSGRSEAVSLLIIDEAAFIEDIEDIFPSAQQTLATGGKCIVVSTPKGVGNWFHQTFTKAELNENGFLPIKLPWFVHPERDQSWRDEQDKLLGSKKMAAQECDCNFEASGDTVIDPEILSFYEKTYVKDPIEQRGITHDLWLWEYPDYTKSYMIVADVSRGDDKDYSTFHILDIVDFRQVGEFKSKIPTRDFARVLISTGIEWNNALLVIENSSIGWDVVQSVLEANYPNVYYSTKSMQDINHESYINKFDNGSMVPGFTNSTKSRPLVIAKLKESLQDKSFIFHSKRFLEELRTFIWNEGKAQALRGYNDDLCMAGGIGCFVRDISIRFDDWNKNLSRAAINGITRVQPYNKNLHPLKGGVNPWKMQIGDNNMEDITWLL